jgi:beta-phosphoglucomutase
MAAAIFDMDGVLVDTGANHRAAWEALLEELGLPAHADAWRCTIGRPAEEAVPLLLGRDVSDHEAWQLARRKRDLYLDLSERGTPAVAGVRAFVAELGRQRVPRAVGTSASHRDVGRLLAGAGLRQHFQVVVTAEDVTLGKPDPEVWILAARRLRTRPETCVVFEDSLVGIEAARRAGMRAIGVCTSYPADELLAAGADRTIDDFEGLEWSTLATA